MESTKSISSGSLAIGYGEKELDELYALRKTTGRLGEKTISVPSMKYQTKNGL
jgi:hypothetical protein